MITPLTRRSVLSSLGAAATLAVAAPARRALAANETIGIGIIGCGGRARQLMKALARIEGTRMVAVCDVYDEHLKAGKFVAGEESFTTVDHHELLARKEVDAVLIATPDHLHVPLSIDAMNAGKDVYCEKPYTHNLTEGAAAIAAEKRTGRIVQIGTQQRSMSHLIEAKKIIEAGTLGPIRKVHMTWNRNGVLKRYPLNIKPEQVDWKRFLGSTAPDQPFDAWRMRNWRWYWDFGGGIFTDLMVHWYDTVNWMIGSGTPDAVTSIGQILQPEGGWETPDTVQTLMTFGKGLQAHFEGTFSNRYGRAHTVIMGEHATLYFDRGRFELLPEGRGDVPEVKPREMILGSGERGQDFYDQPDGELLHLQNWIDCIRSRKPAAVDAKAGVEAAYTAWMCNQPLLKGRAQG